MSAIPECTVCKRHKDWFDEREEKKVKERQEEAEAQRAQREEVGGEGEEDQLFIVPERICKPIWTQTCERLSVSQVQIIYKLYEVLKREFHVGYVCTECMALLEQADSLQFQLHAVTKALKDRIDSHCGLGANKVKRNSDVLDSRAGYRLKYKELRAKKRALIDLENEDAKTRFVADDDLPLVSGRKRSAANHDADGAPFDTKDVKPIIHQQQQQQQQQPENEDQGSSTAASAGDRNSVLSMEMSTLQSAEDAEEQNNGQQMASAMPSTSSATAIDHCGPNNPSSSSASNGAVQPVNPTAAPVFGLNMSFWANISDESYLLQVLSKKNFDTEFSLFTAARGQESLLYDGHLWRRDANHKSKKTAKIVSAWLCSKKWLKTNAGRSELRQGTGCKARLATLADDSQVVLDSLEIEHNHEGNHDEVKHEAFICRLKELISKDPTMDPNQIVATAEVMYGKTYLRTFKNMVKFVQDIQHKLGVPRKTNQRQQAEQAAAVHAPPPQIPQKYRYAGELEKRPESTGDAYDSTATSAAARDFLNPTIHAGVHTYVHHSNMSM